MPYQEPFDPYTIYIPGDSFSGWPWMNSPGGKGGYVPPGWTPPEGGTQGNNNGAPMYNANGDLMIEGNDPIGNLINSNYGYNDGVDGITVTAASPFTDRAIINMNSQGQVAHGFDTGNFSADDDLNTFLGNDDRTNNAANNTIGRLKAENPNVFDKIWGKVVGKVNELKDTVTDPAKLLNKVVKEITGYDMVSGKFDPIGLAGTIGSITGIGALAKLGLVNSIANFLGIDTPKINTQSFLTDPNREFVPADPNKTEAWDVFNPSTDRVGVQPTDVNTVTPSIGKDGVINQITVTTKTGEFNFTPTDMHNWGLNFNQLYDVDFAGLVNDGIINPKKDEVPKNKPPGDTTTTDTKTHDTTGVPPAVTVTGPVNPHAHGNTMDNGPPIGAPPLIIPTNTGAGTPGGGAAGGGSGPVIGGGGNGNDTGPIGGGGNKPIDTPVDNAPKTVIQPFEFMPMPGFQLLNQDFATIRTKMNEDGSAPIDEHGIVGATRKVNPETSDGAANIGP